MARLYGSLVGKALGWGWKAPIHPDDLGKLLETWQRLLASGERVEEEARLQRFDGEYRWFLFRAVPVRDEQGKVVRWYGTNTDIEDRKLAEARVRQAESDLRLVIDTIPVMAWSALPDGSVDFLSQRWLEYYGLSLEDAKSSGWTCLVHPEDLPGIVEKWRAAVASGERYEHVVRARPAGGDYRWCLSRAVPQRDEWGNIIKWYGTTTDIEDLKRAESLLSAQKRTLEMIASGASLADILENLCRTIDAQTPNAISTVLLMDPDGERLWPSAGSRVPSGWREAITPLTIGPCVGSCGTAAFLKKPVITSDIASDPLSVDYRDVALSHGLRASWSQPLVSKNHEVLGTFAMYYAEPRTPSGSDLRLIEGAGHIALIAIERWRTEEALRESEDRFRRMADTLPEVMWIRALEPEKVLYVSPSFERVPAGWRSLPESASLDGDNSSGRP